MIAKKMLNIVYLSIITFVFSQPTAQPEDLKFHNPDFSLEIQKNYYNIYQDYELNKANSELEKSKPESQMDFLDKEIQKWLSPQDFVQNSVNSILDTVEKELN